MSVGALATGSEGAVSPAGALVPEDGEGPLGFAGAGVTVSPAGALVSLEGGAPLGFVGLGRTVGDPVGVDSSTGASVFSNKARIEIVSPFSFTSS